MGLCALEQGCDAWQDFMPWAAAGIYHEALRLAKRKRRRVQRELLILDAPVLDEHSEGESQRAIDNVAGPGDTEGEALDHLMLDEVLDMPTPAQRHVVLGVVIHDLSEQKARAARRAVRQRVS